MTARPFVIVTLLLLTAAPAGSQSAAREALDGIDPVVLLTQGKEVSGKPELKVTRGRFDYLFASADTKAIFEKTPERFEIQLSGACARMGAGVNGNPADYAVVDGRIYIFGSDDCHKRFVAAPAKYLPKPPAPFPTAPADAAAGRALLDRALQSVGGAQRVDTVTTYVESASQVQQRPAGDVTMTIRTLRRYPDEIRVERTMAMGERKQTSANLVTPAGAWFLGQGRAYPQNADARAASLRDYNRHVLALLRSRRSPQFRAVRLAPAAVDGVAVDRVRIDDGLVDVTLNLDKASGQIHSLSFVGRNMDAEIGDYTILLSDFREVGGLRLPFAERALFNGAPDTFLTRKIDSMSINEPIDDALFQPPAGGGL